MWDTPPGVQVIGFDGAVEPRFLRSDINVSLDAERFIYVNPLFQTIRCRAASTSGSNVLDGLSCSTATAKPTGNRSAIRPLITGL